MKKIIKQTPFFLSAVAILAICWYVLSSFELLTIWWALPAIAITTGILAIVVPELSKRFRPFASVISAGWVVLLHLTLLPFFPNKLLGLFVITYIIAILTEIFTSSKLHIGALLLDAVLALISSWISVKLAGPWIILVFVFTFFVIILVDFNFNFSIKGKNNKVKEKKE